MSKTVIKIEDLSKIYRLGEVGTGTISHDLNRWFRMNLLNQEDPYAKIGHVNDRTSSLARFCEPCYIYVTGHRPAPVRRVKKWSPNSHELTLARLCRFACKELKYHNKFVLISENLMTKHYCHQISTD